MGEVEHFEVIEHGGPAEAAELGKRGGFHLVDGAPDDGGLALAVPDGFEPEWAGYRQEVVQSVFTFGRTGGKSGLGESRSHIRWQPMDDGGCAARPRDKMG